jgi:DivIVA domain-containing protein
MSGYYDDGGYDDNGWYDAEYERSPLTPDEIERQGFAIEHRGYHRDQVRDFLYEVAAALRLALQGNQSPVFGPPPTWSHGSADHAPGSPPFDNTRILRAHLTASLRQEAELDTDAEAILERARQESVDIVDQARQEADELLGDAEAEAEHLREKARRMLAAAQEEAGSVVTEAEARARRVLKGARQDALNHAQQVSTTLEARAEQLVEAEQGTLQRLNETRRQLSKVIEELAGAEPVVGPTIEILRLAVDARTTGEPSLTGSPETPVELDPADTGDPSDHPVSTMVRAAVARAMDAAVDEDDDTADPVEDAGEDAFVIDEDPFVIDEDLAGTDAPGRHQADDLLPPAPTLRPPRGDLRDLLSELADIVAEDDEAPHGM